MGIRTVVTSHTPTGKGAAGLEELRPVHSQLVYALRNDQDAGTGSTNRENVTQAQDAPRRVQTDNMFYPRPGGGAIFGAGVGGGPSFGPGCRFELDHFEGKVVLPFYNADSTIELAGDIATDHVDAPVVTAPVVTASVGRGFGRRDRGYR